MGFDAVVLDADGEDWGNWVAWTPYGGKWQAALIGDVVFVAGYSGDSLTERVNPTPWAREGSAAGAIRGQVLTHRQEPHAGLILLARRGEQILGRLRTDAEGRFRFSVLPGEYALEPAPDQQTGPFERQSAVVRAGQDTRLDLEVASPETVTGAAKVRDTSEPFARLQLLFTQDDLSVARTTTDEQGHFRVALAPGDYVLKPRAGTEPFAERVSVGTGEETHVELEVTPAPLVARFSLLGPPERATELQAAYDERLLPVLQRHGLVQTSKTGRSTPAGVASRYFAFDTSADVGNKGLELWSDTAFVAALRSLGAMFGTPRAEGFIDHGVITHVPWAFGERRRAGSGKTVAAGPGTSTRARGRTVTAGAGRRQGGWQSFGVADGLPSNTVYAIAQDRSGDLWFGTEAGASRYDGETFTTYSTQNGLPHDWVVSILEDSRGRLWLGSGSYTGGQQGGGEGGLSLLSGDSLKTYSEVDGLVDGTVTALHEDRRGHLWIGSWGRGVSRYDGRSFTVYTMDDGLPQNRITAILEDGQGDLWFGFQGGVSRYDGERFDTYSKGDGLAHNAVQEVLEGYRCRRCLNGCRRSATWTTCASSTSPALPKASNTPWPGCM